MSAALLEARAVVVRRKGRALVDGISLAVEPGQWVSIIGPNGAGKSTLMKVLAGLMPPDEGDVLLDGTPLRGLRRRALAARISHVPQAPPVNIPFTVGEFVAMARYARDTRLGGLDAESRHAVAEALMLTGCEAMRSQWMHTLSGGEARKVHLAAALAQGGDLLLLDEPTTHLDYRHQREVMQLLQRAHKERGLTVISVQHDLNHGVHESDVVLAMQHGAAFYQGPPAGVVNAEQLSALYETPFAVLQVDGQAHVAALS